MPRPDYVTEEDIIRWSKIIEEDKTASVMAKSAIIREVCYAGLYLSEELAKLQCPDSLIVRIQYSAGKASFGKDGWTIHQQFLDGYKNNSLDFELDQTIN